MTVDDERILEYLSRYRKVAVVGASRNPEKPAGIVASFLIDHGYEVHPVNPSADSILGRPSSASLKDVEGQVEIVDVFRPSASAPAVVKAAAERKAAKGDVAVVWLQEGISSDEASDLARAAGIAFVQDRCIRKEILRLIEGREDVEGA
ncbi:MAG: CoA-binding protein [Planctomycetota bacterium]|jgi:predicted CoA-binding protein